MTKFIFVAPWKTTLRTTIEDHRLIGHKRMLELWGRSELQGIWIDQGWIKEVNGQEWREIYNTVKIVTDKEAKDRPGPIQKQDKAIQVNQSGPKESSDLLETFPPLGRFKFDPESISNRLFEIDISQREFNIYFFSL